MLDFLVSCLCMGLKEGKSQNLLGGNDDDDDDVVRLLGTVCCAREIAPHQPQRPDELLSGSLCAVCRLHLCFCREGEESAGILRSKWAAALLASESHVGEADGPARPPPTTLSLPCSLGYLPRPQNILLTLH